MKFPIRDNLTELSANFNMWQMFRQIGKEAAMPRRMTALLSILMFGLCKCESSIQHDRQLVYRAAAEFFINEAKQSRYFYGDGLIYVFPFSKSAINCKTPPFLNECNIDDAKRRYPIIISEVQRDTFFNYAKNNETSRLLIDDLVRVSDSQVVIDRVLKEVWSNYITNKERIKTIIYLSNVGFNKERTQALLEFNNSTNYSYGWGAGIYVLLEKDETVWKIKTAAISWLAH